MATTLLCLLVLALAAPVQGEQESGAAWALAQLRGTHVVFGSCVDSARGYLANAEADCPDVDIERDGLKRVIKWYNPYPDAAALEADWATVGTAAANHWVALKPGATLASLAAALPEGASTEDYLFAPESTWALVTDLTADELALEPLASQLRFSMPLTARMKVSPLLDFKTVRYVVRVKPGQAAQVANDLLEAGANATTPTTAPTTPGQAASRGAQETPPPPGAPPPNLDVEVKDDENVIEVGAEAAEKAWELFAPHQGVMWLNPSPKSILLNADAAALLQSGFAAADDADAWRADALQPHMSAWARGLTGAGQVVGVADSGLEVEHCMFQSADPAQDAANTAARAAAGNETRHDYADHRKVVQYVAWADGVEGQANGHGTHVVGTIAGKPLAADAVATLRADAPDLYREVPAASEQGVAPDAKVAFFDIGLASEGEGAAEANNNAVVAVSPPSDLAKMLAPAREAGAMVHSNSWGDVFSEYEAMTRSVDAYLFANQDMAVLFAAGNQGEVGGNTVGFPATGKNVIAVGASQSSSRAWRRRSDVVNLAAEGRGGASYWCPEQASGQCADSLAPFSSRGPAPDGRIKPDLVAPGYFLSSAASSGGASDTCGLSHAAGTSMAAPAVAGLATLVRQWFAEGWHVEGKADPAHAFEPMGALVKASLVYSAEFLPGWSMGKPMPAAPGTQAGFGRPRLDGLMDALPAVHGDLADMPRLEAGESAEFQVQVEAGTEVFRATLAWYDAPASVVSSRQIVNDLDISVTHVASGRVYYPNGLDQADRLNTVEQVDVALPEPGAYVVRVAAHAVHVPHAEGGQPFALIYGKARAPQPRIPARTTGLSLFADGSMGPALAGASAAAAVLVIAVALVVVRRRRRRGDAADDAAAAAADGKLSTAVEDMI